MCFSCYHERGSPRIVTDATRHAAWLIQRTYDFSLVGGNAHIVTDDWNLEDSHIDWCLNEAQASNVHEANAEQLAAERACLNALRALTLDERASAMAISEGLIAGAEPKETP